MAWVVWLRGKIIREVRLNKDFCDIRIPDFIKNRKEID
jgi:hypothetical protein